MRGGIDRYFSVHFCLDAKTNQKDQVANSLRYILSSCVVTDHHSLPQAGPGRDVLYNLYFCMDTSFSDSVCDISMGIFSFFG